MSLDHPEDTVLCLRHGDYFYNQQQVHDHYKKYHPGESIPIFYKNTIIGKTKSILEEAQEIIYGDREKIYGSPAANLNRIATLWAAYINSSGKHTIAETVILNAEDVANMMILLKIARLVNQPNHRDSLVDIAGYAALVDRIHNANTDKK